MLLILCAIIAILIVMKNILAISLFLIISFSVSADYSMRRCMLLPVQDSVSGVLGYQVFQEVEKYLQESSWCYYRPNSDILSILGNYRRNLRVHLENREVLKIIAEKMKSGSLIYIDIIAHKKGVDLTIKIMGENGEDVYFKEDTRINSNDTVIIARSISNWLEVYSKNIPYDGRISGVLGDQFTLDVGRASGMSPGRSVKIYRMLRKKKHPLLKEIVDFETVIIGKGRIFHATEHQSQGKIEEYLTNKRLKIKDWVVKEKSALEENREKYKYPDVKKYEFGKLGTVGVKLLIGSGSEVLLTDGISSKKIGGLLYGAALEANIWVTRNIWANFEYSKATGSYAEKEGTLTKTSYSVTPGAMRLLGGYRYLPLGFYYGPQVDGFLGYAKYSYGADTSTADGITAMSLSGILLGVRGSVPVHKSFRMFALFDFMLTKTYEEEVAIHTVEADSKSNYTMEVGGSFVYSPVMTIDGSLMYRSSEARFKETVAKDVKISETIFKLGCTFTY